MSIQIQANWKQTDPASADSIKNKPTFAAVATSGSYNDLTDKPSMEIDTELDASSSNAVSNSIVTSNLIACSDKPEIDLPIKVIMRGDA